MPTARHSFETVVNKWIRAQSRKNITMKKGNQTRLIHKNQTKHSIKSSVSNQILQKLGGKKTTKRYKKKVEYFFKKRVKPKKPYKTCSPSELAGWEKKESKKLPKRKHQENFVIRIRKVKMKKKKDGWEPSHTHIF